MNRRACRKSHLGVVLLLWLVASAAIAGQSAGPLYFGSVAMDIPAVMQQRLHPLTEYLARELSRPVRLRLSPDMPAAIQSAANGEVDLAYLTPVAYLRAHEQAKVELIAKTVTAGRGSFRLMIVVREDSPLQEVEDIAGKRFAFGDKAALLQRAVVVGAGMPLENLGEYRFIGHYDNIVRGVLNGDFDSGILKDTMAYKWKDKGIRILYESPELPPYNIVASAKLDPQLRDNIRQAFLKLDPDNPGHREIIEALDPKYDGFAEVTDSDYDVVRRLVRPFQ